MGDLDQIFINVPALPGSNVYRKDINPDMLKAWCEAVEVNIKADTEHMQKAFNMITQLADGVEVLQKLTSQISTRITELQTVCTYLDGRLKALENLKGDSDNA